MTTPQPMSESTPAITIEGVARVEGILNYCATVDPKSSAKYNQLKNTVLHGLSSSQLKSDQSSPRYTFALGVVDVDLAKLPVSTVVTSCKNTLAGK